MGYCTKFEIEIEGEGDHWVTGVDRDGNRVEVNIGIDHDVVLQEIKDLSGYDDPFDSDIYKWYDHDEHMREISARYPTLLFTLHGEGEECGDLWCAYYQGGKCQRELAKIEYGRFNPVYLK